jgi:PAS domain S-box-containing protein
MKIQLNNFESVFFWKTDKYQKSLDIEGSVEQLYGFTKEEFLDDPQLWFKLIHPEDKPYVKSVIELLDRQDTGSSSVQYRLIRRDSIILNVFGEICKVNFEGETTFQGYLVDITKREQHFAFNKRRESLLTLLSESISDSFNLEIDRQSRVVTVLGNLGKITNTDRVYIFDKISGTNERPVLNHNYEWCKEGIESQMSNDVVFDVDLKELTPRWYEQLVLSKKHISSVVRLMPSEEREILEPQGIKSILVTPIWYEKEFFGFIGFDDCSDDRLWVEEEIDLLTVFGSLIIASWKYEDSLFKLETQLKLLQRLQAEKNQFIKMVSHQFKTPLSVIKLNTSLLKEACSNDSTDKSQLLVALKRIENSVFKFDELIDAILVGVTISDTSYDVDQTHTTNFQEWLELFANEVHEFNDEIDKFEIINVDNSDSQITLPFNSKTLYFIVETLFANAKKYRGNGNATIEVKYSIIDNAFLHFVFTDYGIGIDEDDIHRIPEPFFRGNNVINISGTGIGLSMVKDTIEKVGGTFDISSEVGVFTTISLKIPLTIL